MERVTRRGVAFQRGDGPLLRWAYRDPSLKAYYLNAFSKQTARPGPLLFFLLTAVSVVLTAKLIRGPGWVVRAGSVAGVTIETLGAAIRRGVSVPVDLAPRLEDVVPAIVRVAKRGDVVITLGAGSIGSVPDRLVDALASSDGARS